MFKTSSSSTVHCEAAIATDRKKKILYLLEFKRTTDQSELKRQYEDMVEALMEVGRNMAKGL